MFFPFVSLCKEGVKMLSKEKISAYSYAILSTLEESGGQVPLISIFMLFDYDADQYESMMFILERVNWVRRTPEVLHITTTGLEVVKQFEAIVEKSKNPPMVDSINKPSELSSVGDPNQPVYKFAGATQNELSDEPELTELEKVVIDNLPTNESWPNGWSVSMVLDWIEQSCYRHLVNGSFRHERYYFVKQLLKRLRRRNLIDAAYGQGVGKKEVLTYNKL
jgi:hypothetical protein